MATVDWDRASALAQQAIDLPSIDQAQLLKRLSEESVALADAVASLLHGLKTADSATAVDVEPDADDGITPQPGERLGAYRLLHSIGSGGMGSVFLAERADRAFEKQVAIKIVGRGPMDPRTAARLRGERQILASLDHPNIARLLDGGTTVDGLPYLVMEYIDGENLMGFCDGQHLTIDKRLELFLDICDAVQYAHQNLVVHRDLKPSNILVAEDGTVKLLDFGIAKMLDTNIGEQTVALTQANMVVMTPEYASPEQAVGKPITTSSDIYALGVLLYQLLTGRVPHRVSLRRPEELFRLILDVIPPPPSQRVVADERPIGEQRRYIELDPIAVAENRGTTPEKLIRRLRGDLDYIALMALRKEPERRYPSAQQFGDDIRRHLTDLPVVAQPDSTAYRARKFVRRHWIGLGTAAALLITAIGAAVVFALQAERISKERDVAQAQRIRAEQVSEFVIGLTKISDPIRTPTFSDMILEGITELETLDAQPELQQELRHIMGDIAIKSGEYGLAHELLTNVLAYRQQTFGEASREVATTRNRLGNTLNALGDFQAALAMHEQAMTTFTSIHGDEHSAVGETWQYLGHVFRAMDRVEDAEQAYRRSRDILAATLGDNHYHFAVVSSDLAATLTLLGHLDDAEAAYRQALTINQRTASSNDPEYLLRKCGLALVMHWKGNYLEAEQLFNEAIPALARILGPSHPNVTGPKGDYGRMLHDLGELRRAESLFREALSGFSEKFGAEHRFVGYGKVNLAILLHDRGKLQEAETLLRDALAIYDQTLGAGHAYVGAALTALGNLLVDRGLAMEALPLLQQGVGIFEVSLPAEHWQLANARCTLAKALTILERPSEALALFDRGLPILQQTWGDEHRLTRQASGWLAAAKRS